MSRETNRRCKVSGCSNLFYAKGMCSACYTAYRKRQRRLHGKLHYRGRASGIRPLIPQGVVTQIPLPTGNYALIDTVDAIAVGQHNWHEITTSRTSKNPIHYAATNLKYQRADGYVGFRMTYLHRFILDLHKTKGLYDKDKQVDHINRDGLDCRRSNLRVVPAGVNVMNQQHQPSTTGYFHVYNRSGSVKKPFRAIIYKDNKRIDRLFATDVEAALWVDVKMVKLYGHYIRPWNLNFPGHLDAYKQELSKRSA